MRTRGWMAVLAIAVVCLPVTVLSFEQIARSTLQRRKPHSGRFQIRSVRPDAAIGLRKGNVEPRVLLYPRAERSPSNTRNLLYTPEDAARVKFFHPLLTPEIQRRVKTLPVLPHLEP